MYSFGSIPFNKPWVSSDSCLKYKNFHIAKIQLNTGTNLLDVGTHFYYLSSNFTKLQLNEKLAFTKKLGFWTFKVTFLLETMNNWQIQSAQAYSTSLYYKLSKSLLLFINSDDELKLMEFTIEITEWITRKFE